MIHQKYNDCYANVIRKWFTI